MPSRLRPILLCGDPHGVFDHILNSSLELDPSAVVLLGDLEPGAPLDLLLAPIVDHVWWIPGNHDADSVEASERTWFSGLPLRNLHGQVVALPDGRVLAGLGNVFRRSVWMPDGDPPDPRSGVAFPSRETHVRATSKQHRHRGGSLRKHWGSIYPQDYWHLFCQSADILVTHVASGYHPLGFKVLDGLARAMGATIVAHGHHHDARWRHEDQSSMWRAEGFKSIGVGLRGITMLEHHGTPSVLVPGELDDHPLFRPLPNAECRMPNAEAEAATTPRGDA